jgi:hypothetical protein
MSCRHRSTTKDRLDERLTELGAEAKRLLGAFTTIDSGGRFLAERLGEIERETDRHHAGIADLERRLRACAALRTEGEHVAKLLDAFDEVWEALVPEERREVLHGAPARLHARASPSSWTCSSSHPRSRRTCSIRPGGAERALSRRWSLA